MATIRGGDKLQKALAKLAVQLRNPGTLRVGFLEGSTYPGGTSVAMIAAIQDFGAPSRGIPPRPFFRNTIKSKSSEWAPGLAMLLKQNGYDAGKSLRILGEVIAGQIRQGIVDTNSPPLKPATIKRKGHSKPLVDSGHLLASVDYEIK